MLVLEITVVAAHRLEVLTHDTLMQKAVVSTKLVDWKTSKEMN